MKELKPIDKVYLEDYDLYVKKYLTLAEIQNIVDNIMQFDTWAEREKTKNLMIFIYATGIGQNEDKVNEIDYELYVENGVFTAVRHAVENTHLIESALRYSESTMRALYQIVDHLPELLQPIEKVVNERVKKAVTKRGTNKSAKK